MELKYFMISTHFWCWSNGLPKPNTAPLWPDKLRDTVKPDEHDEVKCLISSQLMTKVTYVLW